MCMKLAVFGISSVVYVYDGRDQMNSIARAVLPEQYCQSSISIAVLPKQYCHSSIAIAVLTEQYCHSSIARVVLP